MLENNATYVVPATWVHTAEGETWCWWPPYKDADVKRAIKRGDDPEPGKWESKLIQKLYPLTTVARKSCPLLPKHLYNNELRSSQSCGPECCFWLFDGSVELLSENISDF